jgi:hypothetical protein
MRIPSPDRERISTKSFFGKNTKHRKTLAWFMKEQKHLYN